MPSSRPKHKFSILEKHKYINLTTFNNNGDAITNPVWFALDGSKLYTWTWLENGKIERIRNNNRVRIQPSTINGKARGEAMDGSAYLLSEAKMKAAQRLMDAKYGMLKNLLTFIWKLQRRQLVYLEILPTGKA